MATNLAFTVFIWVLVVAGSVLLLAMSVLIVAITIDTVKRIINEKPSVDGANHVGELQ